MKRTHTCGELRKSEEKKEVTLCGWNKANRNHGGLIFINLRDRYGITQIVADPNHSKECADIASKLHREDVLRIKGKVRLRPGDMKNPEMPTGDVEVLADSIEILAKSDDIPLDTDDNQNAYEDTRLKYRYLDLRRPSMQNNLITRHKAANAARAYMDKHNFLEVETPLLVRATPEGARDYLVPSRVNNGKFYALPQSPQLYKQILMIAGIDRYFQFPRCLRDEDLRADRQPEHTQIDLEMSFVEETDIMDFVEGLFKHILKEVKGISIKEKFTVLSYKEAIDRFGIDKPDMRFALELQDVTDIVKQADFNVFKDTAKNGGIIKCIIPEKDFSRKEIDKLTEIVKVYKAKGLAVAKVVSNKLDGGISKFLNDAVQTELLQATGAKDGSTILFVADKPSIVNEALAQLRNHLGKELELYDPNEFKFCWVKDFPLFAYDEETKSWTPEHHMFSMPKEEHLELLEKDPSKVLGDLFDIALNGIELGSGSIRINRPDIQKRVMKVIGMSEKEAEAKFGFLLEAYKYGGPPHGGMGLGFDRFVALMSGTNDIREVIAFPKSKSAESLMDGSPSNVDKVQLEELGVSVKK